MTETILSLEDKIERRTKICELVQDFEGLAAEFEAVSESRKAITDRIRAMGISKKAFQHAVQLRKLDEDKRQAYIESITELSAALGLNLQLNLELGDPHEDTGNEDEQDDGKITAIRGALESVA